MEIKGDSRFAPYGDKGRLSCLMKLGGNNSSPGRGGVRRTEGCRMNNAVSVPYPLRFARPPFMGTIRCEYYWPLSPSVSFNLLRLAALRNSFYRS